MKSSRKYQAFTLLELTIAMLIAAICLGIAFYVLNTFSHISINQQKEKQQSYLLLLFQYRLQKEAFEAERIWFAENSLLLERSGLSTQYAFLDSAIVRIQGDVATDTLRGHILNLDVRYLKDLEQELVQSCSFDLQIEDAAYPFVLQKIYSAEELVSLSQNTQE
ncbi:type II secretion system protein [Sphingobacterium sp. LRF_L2]|uniref:type II secretion system protein n=1 Tax=Sphingobacterium sp. LRF_L2 TaxID=3369421 RepID=UPI003F627B6C